MHTSMRSGNATALLAIIVLTILTLLFGFLAYSSHGNRQEIIAGANGGGSYGIKSSTSLNTLQKNIATAKAEIRALRSERERLTQSLHHTNLGLSQFGMYRHDWREHEKLGITSPADPQATIGSGIDVWELTLSRVTMNHDTLNSRAAAMNALLTDDFKTIRDAAEDAERARDDVQGQIADEEDSFNQKRDQLIERQDLIQERRDTFGKAHRTRVAELSIKRNQLESQIRDLLELELLWLNHLESDGRVLETVPGSDHIVIDLGTSHGIKAGLRFDIFAWEKGHYVTKGMLEVTAPSEHISSCRLIEDKTNIRNPIISGDHIGSPVFDQHRQLSFVLAGEFATFNKSDITSFIERTGNVVRTDIGPSVDFVVAGERAETELDAARDYRVIAMYEEELIRFLDTTFVPK